MTLRSSVAVTALAAVVVVGALAAAPGAWADGIEWTSFPADPTVLEATSSAGAKLDYTLPTAVASKKSVAVSVTCTPAPGIVAALGKTEVRCIAVRPGDDDDPAVRKFTVIVRDTTPPAISGVPDSITRTAAVTSKTATVDYPLPKANDVVDGSVPVSCKPAPGAAFEIGTTTVKCTATDKAENTATASFTVVVNPPPVDKTPPTFASTADVVAEAKGAMTRVDFTVPTATDDVDGSVQAACAPAPGSSFAVGRTTVTCKATDAAGNTASTRFDVVVNDTTPPDLSVPDPLKISVTDQGGIARSDSAVAAFLAAAKAVDVVDGPVPVTNDAPATIPIGMTSIAFTAVDKAGNRARKEVTVTVVQQPRPAPAAATPTAPNTPPPTTATPPPAAAPPDQPKPAAAPAAKGDKTPAAKGDKTPAMRPPAPRAKPTAAAPLRPPEPKTAPPAETSGKRAAPRPAPRVEPKRRPKPARPAAAPARPKVERAVQKDNSAAPAPKKQQPTAVLTNLLKKKPTSPLGLIVVLALVGALVALVIWGVARVMRAEAPAPAPEVEGADHPPPFRAGPPLPTNGAAPAVAGPDSCEIALWHGYTRSHFYASGIGEDGGEIAYGESPSFRSHAVANGNPGEAVLAAHEQLLRQLEADGWTVTGANGTWYSLRLTRVAD